nr:ROK family protein [Vagococcus allomyrinae]
MVFDFGGSAIKYGVWHLESLQEQSQVVTPKTLAEFLQTLVRVKEALERDYQFTGCACSSPGAVNQAKRVIEGNCAISFVHEPTFYQSLEQALHLPVTIENDANCAALAEVAYGAAAGKEDVLAVVIGSGIGGAVIKQGKIEKGHHLFGGEFGFMLLEGEWNFSQLATPVAMAKRVSVMKGLTETALSGKEVFDLAEAGDAIAEQEVQRLYYYLAVGLYNLQTSIDPEVIVIGGGISARTDLLAKIEEQVELIFNRGQKTAIRPDIRLCQFKNEANLLGAVANYREVRFHY